MPLATNLNGNTRQEGGLGCGSLTKSRYRRKHSKCAVGVFYRSMGEAMEIPFNLLPSHKAGFTDGIHFAQEVCDLTVEYEKTAVKPTQSTLFINRRLMGLETANYPSILRPVFESIIATRLDEHIRVNMG